MLRSEETLHIIIKVSLFRTLLVELGTSSVYCSFPEVTIVRQPAQHHDPETEGPEWKAAKDFLNQQCCAAEEKSLFCCI